MRATVHTCSCIVIKVYVGVCDQLVGEGTGSNPSAVIFNKM